MGIIALGPVGAQSRKAVRQAKKDTKVLVKELKADGYKSLDNVKLDDAVNGFLTSKYSTRNSVEVIGRAIDKDLNDAKAEARADAVYGYPEENIVDSFFIYRKSQKRYEVICYALLKGRSAKEASKDKTQYRRRSDGTEATIAAANAEREAREARTKAEKERKKAEKAARKAARKAESKAQKAREQADQAWEKAEGYK